MACSLICPFARLCGVVFQLDQATKEEKAPLFFFSFFGNLIPAPPPPKICLLFCLSDPSLCPPLPLGRGGSVKLEWLHLVVLFLTFRAEAHGW